MTSIEVNLEDEWAKDTLGPYGECPDKKTPFDLYIYADFLQEKDADKLREDIVSSVEFEPKDNDLYKFKQSPDLLGETDYEELTPIMNNFIDVMLGKVKEHLEKVTGLVLSKEYFDITVSRYNSGNYLLCHNDDMKYAQGRHGRVLAFVYYLNTRPWSRDDGGALALFDSDDRGEPVSVNNRIIPKPNTLVVFKTSSKSWHSVEEVYCKDDSRLSINGWYHCEPANDNSDGQSIELCPYSFFRPTAVDTRLENFFKNYINQEYLMERTCYMIRKRFKRKSEINLVNFLVKEKYEEISEALKEATSNPDNLSHIGPYNKRNYKRIHVDKLPESCKELYDAFKSELFFLLLYRLTGLNLQPPSLIQDFASNYIDTSSSDDDDCDDESDEDSDDDYDDSDSDDWYDDDDDDDDSDGDDDDDHQEKESAKTGSEAGTTAKDTKDESKPESEPGLPREEASILSEIVNILENDSSSSEGQSQDPPGEDSSTSTSKDEDKKLTEEGCSTSRAVLGEIDLNKSSPKKRTKLSDPLGRAEFRHFEHGSYTMNHDYSYEMGEKSALDVILHFNHDFEVNLDDGGYITYIDGSACEEDPHNMDGELLTMEPKSNCLSLVYRRGDGTCRFLKYISRSHNTCNYQDLSCVYYEKKDDLPNNAIDAIIVEQTRP